MPPSLRIYILSQGRSLYSTVRFFEEATKLGHKVKVLPPLDISMLLDRNKTELYFNKHRLPSPDCIVPRVGQKKSAYTLAVLRQFEMMGVTSLNTSKAIGRSRDKLRTLQILAQEGLGIVRTFFLDSTSDIETALKLLGGAPVIIKVTEGTQGVGVILAESARSARSILESLLSQGQHVLVQEFIEEANGKDIRAIVLGSNVIASMERSSLGDDFRSNIHRGGTQSQTRLGIEAERTAKLAARALGLRFAGVDIIMSKRGPLILEVNPSPGLEGIEKSSNINIAEKAITFLAKTKNQLRNKK